MYIFGFFLGKMCRENVTKIIFFLVKTLFSIDGSLILYISLEKFDIKNIIAALNSLQTKLSFWSSFLLQCAQPDMLSRVVLVPTTAETTKANKNSKARGFQLLILKLTRWIANMYLLHIIVRQFLNIFSGYVPYVPYNLGTMLHAQRRQCCHLQ
jgi:hypothetical protein